MLEERPELLSSEQLIALAHELHQLGGPSELVSLAGERLFFEDFIQRCYTDDGNGDGRFTPAGADYFRKLMAVSTGQHAWDIPVVSSAVFAGRKEMTDAYRRLFSEAEKSLRIPQFAPGPAAVEQELIALESTEWKRARFAPLGVLMPAFGHAARIAFRTALLRDATLTTIALELYRRKAGSIPESLSELVSTFLPSVPVDLADGQPIRYKRFGDSYTLYSIGSDRIDNGGKPPQTTTDDSSVVNFMSQNAKLNCDWVFFPRPHPEDTTPKTGGLLGGPGSK